MSHMSTEPGPYDNPIGTGPYASQPPTDGRPDHARINQLEVENGIIDPPPVHVASVPASKYLMALTGFDEIAIADRFGTKVTALRKEDAVTLGRALAFIHYRRNEGARDLDAYDRAMNLTMQQVVDFFPPEAKTDADDATPGGLEDTYAEQAVAVVRIGIAPSEWKALTAAERAAIIEEHNHCAAQARRS